MPKGGILDLVSNCFKLAVVELMIKALHLQQAVVVALLDNVAILHNQYHVSFLDGGKPVSYNKAGLALHKAVERLLYLYLRSGVYG